MLPAMYEDRNTMEDFKMNFEIKRQLNTLELSDLAEVIEKNENNLKLLDMSYDERLELMLEELITTRRNRLISRLIKNAELKYPNATLESLDYETRELKAETINAIASMGFMNQATNIIITGPTGAGKTYLASMLGVEACKQTYRTHYIRMSDMLMHIKNHKDNLREQVRFRKRLGNYKLLIIDEWLSYKVDEKELKFIYELIEHRCGINSTIFVSQYGVKEWHERLCGGTLADSIMDRIIHNSYLIPTNEVNLRKLYDSKKVEMIFENKNY